MSVYLEKLAEFSTLRVLQIEVGAPPPQGLAQRPGAVGGQDDEGDGAGPDHPVGRPLLIEGPAGVGKTEIAKVMAAALDRELVRLQCYEGLDESKACISLRSSSRNASNSSSDLSISSMSRTTGFSERIARSRGRSSRYSRSAAKTPSSFIYSTPSRSIFPPKSHCIFPEFMVSSG